MIRHRSCPSPWGPLTLVADPRGLLEIRWPDEPPTAEPSDDEVPDDGSPTPDGSIDLVDGGAVGDARIATEANDVEAILDQAVVQLGEYFAGHRLDFDIPLAPVGTPFQLAAWSVLRQIPYGATWTYRDQAVVLGDARKARAVGGANGRNPLPIVVPCHRVCASGGGLGGFTGGLDLKRWLLDHERHTLETVRANRQH